MGLLDLHLLDGSTAILGGSFDPVHNGHLHIARQILYWSRIAKILFVPNGNHHFKKDQIRLCYNDRYALLKKAISSEPRFEISSADRDGSGFTVDLMKHLAEENPGTSYVFTIGSDNLEKLPQWHDFEWLSKNVHWLLLPRPGYKIELSIISMLRISIIPIELSDISSTEIRHRVDAGQSIAQMVPENLEAKIIELYENNTPTESHVRQA